MLKLSHNPRFKKEEEKGLRQKWDAVITSTDWLKDVCEKPTENWDYRAQKATRVGWWNYSFDAFKCSPLSRSYGNGVDRKIKIGFLIHAHPLKGTKEVVLALGNIFKKYNQAVEFVGVGEVAPNVLKMDLPNFKYCYALPRDDMAQLFQTFDIWIGMSKSEGLGRMGLEAMSASCAVILSDTGAEYAKNEENCLIVQDVNEAVGAIDRIIQDPILASKLRQNGFDTAAKLSSPTRCMDNIEKVIEGLYA